MDKTPKTGRPERLEDLERQFTPAQAAAEVSVNIRTIYRLIKDGHLTPVDRPGHGRLYILESVLVAWKKGKIREPGENTPAEESVNR